MKTEWSLDILYKGFDDPKFKTDMENVDKMIAEINEFAKALGTLDAKTTVLEYIRMSEESDLKIADLFRFASLRSSANARDGEASSVMGRLMGKLSGIAKAETAIQKYIANIENLDELIESDPQGV